jgi:hypothetical protein
MRIFDDDDRLEPMDRREVKHPKKKPCRAA